MRLETYVAIDSTDSRPVVSHRVSDGITEYRNPLSGNLAAAKLRAATMAMEQFQEEIKSLRKRIAELETQLQSK